MGRQRVMILEDDEDLAEGLCLSLQSDVLEFVCCGTAPEARERIEKECFDLFVLDINLPDGSGLELCREIRRQSNHTPIALLTAKDLELDIVTGL